MKWPLLGIIFVVCLQLAFTAFNTIDRPIESLVAVNAVTRDTNPVVDVLDDSMGTRFLENYGDRSPRRFKVGDTVISASTRHRNAFSDEPAYASSKRTVSIADAKKLRAMSQYVAMQRPFESTVITYPRVILAASESENYPVPTNTVATSKKGSFISRSASILKKPYTWIKALGSKFN